MGYDSFQNVTNRLFVYKSYIYIYIYMCVCVCVCACVNRIWHHITEKV